MKIMWWELFVRFSCLQDSEEDVHQNNEKKKSNSKMFVKDIHNKEWGSLTDDKLASC